MHASPGTIRSRRRGVILLVVITLLTLFAVVGVTFVIFAQAEASSARVWREGESTQRPDMDPEMLLAYFLSQLAYGTDNQHSALRGHDLARNMYGTTGSTQAYNGLGRLHTDPNPAADQFYKIDYTKYSAAVPDPSNVPGPNVPYTYPDFNNAYLGAVGTVDGKDGAVLIPSFVRYRPDGAGGLVRVSLRPDATHHPNFPAPEDGILDVKNRAGSPGYKDPITGNWANNDSPWLDIGFPVMRMPDGRKVKPLFAPFIEDLDNRVNVNVAGLWTCATLQNLGGWNATQMLSHEGWGVWEINPSRILNQASGTPAVGEARNLFRGNGATQGRYDSAFWGTGSFKLNARFAARGPFYSMVDYNSVDEFAGAVVDGYPVPINATTPVMRMPGVAGWTGTFAFPWFHWQFHNAGAHTSDELWCHPRGYNFFSPEQNRYGSDSFPPGQLQRDRVFAVSNMEALLRYGDRGSPALTSALFQLCPQSLAQSKSRRLVTTHSFDLLRAGVAPYLWPDPAAQPYRLSASGYPAGSLLSAANAPNAGEYTANYQSLYSSLSRIDLNRTLPDYPGIDGTTFRIDAGGYGTATAARQRFAQDLFNVLWRITGAADPANASLTPEEKDILRYLAQLAVNLVDYVDTDPYSTPFKWGTTDADWVFGTEQPWCVINEAYVELGNDSPDVGQMMASNPYKMRCWVELLNPLDNHGGVDYTGGVHPTALRDSAEARLQVANSGSPYAAYQLVVATAPVSNAKDNVRGDPTAANIKLMVSDWTPEPNPAAENAPVAGVDVNKVLPINAPYLPLNSPPAPPADGGNRGLYLVGPRWTGTADNFPGTGGPKPTLRVQHRTDYTTFNGSQYLSSMVYDMSNTTDLTQPLTEHTMLLRRLACPHMPHQPTPGINNNYNPYVTVDVMDGVPTMDAVAVTNTGARANAPATVANVDQRYSVGKNQPYGGHSTQRVNQKPATALMGMPQHTFFKTNVQVIDNATGREKANNGTPVHFNFDWLRFADRWLVSPMEALQVPGCKPHELTQKFMVNTDMNTGQPTSRFQHLAPWTTPNTRLYRLFEFLEGGTRMQFTPVGGRAPGKININTVFDLDTFLALCDPRPANQFSEASATAIYNAMIASRTKGPNGTPGPNDRPFQFGSGDLDDTLLRIDAATGQPMFHVTPQPVHDHPHLKTELLRKIANNVTTRSNVFAIWLTVGFFEADDSDPTVPARLGREVGRSENRHVRHRMFAIIDRSNLALAVNPTTRQVAAPLAPPAQQPFFLESMTAVTNPGSVTIQVPLLQGGFYEGTSWGINNGSVLVIDSGDSQEIVTVTAVNAGAHQFTATFANRHQAGFSISNAVLGNPGPQPRLDPRNPMYSGVIRYFSIIE